MPISSARCARVAESSPLSKLDRSDNAGSVPTSGAMDSVSFFVFAPAALTAESTLNIVRAGSVGIAGNQTGVYPFATPGGWRLLGRTPLAMFRTDRDELSRLSIGDRVRFTPISAERFAALEKE